MPDYSLDSSPAPRGGDAVKPWLFGAGFPVLLFALIKLVLHLYAGRGYGFFVDELYYLDCARHLDWGYVDQPPLVALLAWVERACLGDSLSALRLLAALAGAALVLLTGMLARELGGGRMAQATGALSALLAPGLLAMHHFFSMNAFEPLFWMGSAWLLIRLIRTGEHRLWLWFGVVAGLGLENKYSMGLFGFALLAGLLLSGQQRLFASCWFWLGGAIAFLIFLPNLLWNIQHHFPFLELQRNIKHSGRDVALSPFHFLLQESMSMLPLSLPIWLAGLFHFFFASEGRRFRFLGWAWLITALIIVLLSPRIYYLFPAFPLLFAGGAVLWERWLARPRWSALKWSYGALMIVFGALIVPIVLPVLPVEACIRYQQITGQQQPAIENKDLGPLPQLMADQFGWPEMAAAVAQVYNGLPADTRARTAIFAQNYGQAGAIDQFGPRYGLPEAISGHQSHYLWGPRGYSGDSMIVMGDRQVRLEQLFTSVRKVAHLDPPYSMPYEHIDIFYCQGIKQPLAELWPKVKNWD